MCVCAQIGNCSLSSQFGSLARELDVTEAKTPADIYKSHLAETGSTARRGGGGDEAAQVTIGRWFVVVAHSWCAPVDGYCRPFLPAV